MPTTRKLAMELVTQAEYVQACIAHGPIDLLGALAELRWHVDRLEAQTVVDARNDGSTWEEIGRALGLSRQSAHERHASHVARPKEE